MKLNLLVLAILFSSLNILSAQTMPSPVDWTFDTQKVNDKEYDIIFTAEIDNGWFIYSQFLEGDGPVPTSFTFDELDGLELINKAIEESDNKKEGHDEIFMMNLIKFGKKVKFTQRVKVADANTAVSGYLTFMTCNNESCLPPRDIDFEITLN